MYCLYNEMHISVRLYVDILTYIFTQSLTHTYTDIQAALSMQQYSLHAMIYYIYR